MSADLLAAFGDPNAPPSEPPGSTSRGPQVPSQNTQQQFLIPLDFEDNTLAGSNDHQPEDEVFGEFSSAVPPPKTQTSLSMDELWREDGGSTVLFDASTEAVPEEDDDEWGEFEYAETVSTGNKVPDLLSSDKSEIEEKNVNMPSTAVFKPPITSIPPKSQNLVDLLSDDIDAPHQSAMDSAIGAVRPKNSKPADERKPDVRSPPSPSWQVEPDDDWGDFTDGIATEGATTAGDVSDDLKATQLDSTRSQPNHETPKPTVSTNKIATKAVDAKAERNSSQIRPTNIPPPSILLAVFPPLLEELHQRATRFIASTKGKDHVSPDPNLAQSIASSLKVMARIFLGRPHRWKRDTILSQSTRIGPSRSGKSGGMKLSSVNKNENVKEEKEAVEVLEAWRRRGAVLNSAILAAGGHSVPILTGNVQVRTAAGALKASHACALCGLKREERIPRVDEDVYDSFEEWWVDHWGHADCKVFWETNSATLDQR
ncbi:hypothetical protein AJ80_07060 [Polytolypa hystricis UAMH7299]|uniref:Uncharacterized protein n=1 Tax=Polytolypa hystricis (strain UAMH7299) TaxID=1447883 RepID=A0A2B7XRI5_POLH7|nr:hypothetical protein AJ80_07060 [Polytolypa hystricis UAMH7299]